MLTDNTVNPKFHWYWPTRLSLHSFTGRKSEIAIYLVVAVTMHIDTAVFKAVYMLEEVWSIVV